MSAGPDAHRIPIAVTEPEDREPFDETAVTRGRRRCYFCDTDRSDEWTFVEKLAAFICRDCRERIERIEDAPKDDSKAG